MPEAELSETASPVYDRMDRCVASLRTAEISSTMRASGTEGSIRQTGPDPTPTSLSIPGLEENDEGSM